MSLWTMEEETRNKLAIILILHKGVLKNLFVECLWYLEQWEVPIIPEAPLKSQKSCYFRFIQCSINHLPEGIN